MSDYLNKKRRRLGARGNNESDALTNNLYNYLDTEFHNSPTYRVAGVISDKHSDITEIEIRVIEIGRMGDIKEILFRPYQGLSIGTYLQFDGDTWMIYDKYGIEENGKVKAVVEKCTEKLRWKAIDGDIKSHYCIASATQLGSKSNQGKNALEWNKFDVRLPMGQIFVFVEKNSETEQVHISQRFILGSNTYEIVGIDDVTSTNSDDLNDRSQRYGYLQLTAALTTGQDGDDFNTGIAYNRYDDDGDPDGEEGGRVW